MWGWFPLADTSIDVSQLRACKKTLGTKDARYLAERLERSTMTLDIAVDEYDQAAAHFENSRCGAIFGRTSTRKRAKALVAGNTEFKQNLRNGLAFNLPVCTLGGIALLVYLLK